MTERIFYPDVHPEVHSVDGYTSRLEAADITWANLISRAGEFAYSNLTDIHVDFTKYFGAPPQWGDITRGHAIFYIPYWSNITSARISLYGKNKIDPDNVQPDVNIFSGNQASNTNLVIADHLAFGGSVPYCDTPITYANVDAAGWNHWTLNDAALAVLRAIEMPGVFKIMIRNANFDVAGVDPNIGVLGAWGAGFEFYSTEQGVGFKPKLTLYSEPASESADETVVGDKVALEAIRNVEIVYGGRFFIGKTGNAVYESRYHRNV